MEILKKFKYGTEIKKVIDEYDLPLREDLNPPNNKETCRFVHSTDHENNHKPQYKINPKRFIQPGDRSSVTIDGFALSCFPSVDEAEGFFKKITKNFKNFAKINGNCICAGNLENADGLVSEEQKRNYNHFELYEFKECNLNKKFTIVKNIA